jgi:hypothetical protein
MLLPQKIFLGARNRARDLRVVVGIGVAGIRNRAWERD